MFFNSLPKLGPLGLESKPAAQNYPFIAIPFYLFIALLCVKMSSVTWDKDRTREKEM